MHQPPSEGQTWNQNIRHKSEPWSVGVKGTTDLSSVRLSRPLRTTPCVIHHRDSQWLGSGLHKAVRQSLMGPRTVSLCVSWDRLVCIRYISHLFTYTFFTPSPRDLRVSIIYLCTATMGRQNHTDASLVLKILMSHVTLLMIYNITQLNAMINGPLKAK